MENEPIGNSVSVEEQNKNIELPMGHRSSKSAIANPTSCADSYRSYNTTRPSATVTSTSTALPASTRNSNSGNSNRIPIPLPGTTINVQIQENSTINPTAVVASSSTQLSDSDNSSLTSLAGSSLQNRQIIIKIQLAKMENGNDSQAVASATQRAVDADESSVSNITVEADRNSLESLAANNSAQFVNLTLNGNFIYADDGTNDLVSLSSDSSSRASRTAGGCASLNNNNNNNISDLSGRLNTLQIQEDWEHDHATDATPEYCEVLDGTARNSNSIATSNELRRSDSSLTDTVGCLNGHRRSKTVRTSSSLDLSRRRCRDALRRILEPSSNKSLNKSKKQNKKHSDTTQPLSTSSSSSNTVLPSTSSKAHLTHTASQTQENTTISTSATSMTSTSTAVTMSTPSSSNNIIPISIATVGTAASSSNTVNATNQVSATIWTPSQNDLIIPITSPPQFVVVQCPPTSVVTLGRIDYNSIRLSSTEIGHPGVNNVNGFNVPTESLVKQAHNGPIVHSQVDFVHCLVPDLDKIVNSSFYWGKIDRYEAERLLEGKPEGTFLLRDSAQEEYLFSVTFRKFGRSLHARIEQSGHKFGFDCHDPSVFTAPTVTGLLQHYKDPACVMFFEPMLAIPLHRKTTFSLQELARGVIVSNTTYDGINELGLPVRVRAFLKEYYYKQKLRVKPFDKMVYSCT